MTESISIPADRWREVARRLKHDFDALQAVDSGWRAIDVQHPAWGRDVAGDAPVIDHLAGPLIVTTAEPGDEAEAVVVVVGFTDPYTGDIWLGNDFTVRSEAAGGAEPDDRRLPAVAFVRHGGAARAVLGMVEEGEEPRFSPGAPPAVAAPVREWIEDILRGTRVSTL
ncbi:MAG: hypothetical protein U0531_04515 [Dehalococcoidia bacterium]